MLASAHGARSRGLELHLGSQRAANICLLLLTDLEVRSHFGSR